MASRSAFAGSMRVESSQDADGGNEREWACGADTVDFEFKACRPFRTPRRAEPDR